MHPVVFSGPWTDAWKQAINASSTYRTAAASWEGAIAFVVEPGEGEAGRAVWADLWHGECRASRPATPDDLAGAPFLIRGAAKAWESVLSGAMEPIAALMLGHLTLARGGLGRLVLQVPAAREMVRVAGEVTTRLVVESAEAVR